MTSKRSGIEVKVIKWSDGHEEIAIHFLDLDQMVTINPDSARNLAFLLTECADFVTPPFDQTPTEDLLDVTTDDESIALFGPYDACFNFEDVDEDDDEDDEDEDEDDECHGGCNGCEGDCGKK